MITKKIFGGSLANSLVEVFLIVIGVLIALSVDEYRHDVEEKGVEIPESEVSKFLQSKSL